MKKLHIGWRFWLLWVIFMAVLFSLSYIGIDIVERLVVTRMVTNLWAREAFMIAGLALLSSLAATYQTMFIKTVFNEWDPFRVSKQGSLNTENSNIRYSLFGLLKTMYLAKFVKTPALKSHPRAAADNPHHWAILPCD